jgi:hypothetical protein
MLVLPDLGIGGRGDDGPGQLRQPVPRETGSGHDMRNGFGCNPRITRRRSQVAVARDVFDFASRDLNHRLVFLDTLPLENVSPLDFNDAPALEMSELLDFALHRVSATSCAVDLCPSTRVYRLRASHGVEAARSVSEAPASPP